MSQTPWEIHVAPEMYTTDNSLYSRTMVICKKKLPLSITIINLRHLTTFFSLYFCLQNSAIQLFYAAEACPHSSSSDRLGRTYNDLLAIASYPCGQYNSQCLKNSANFLFSVCVFRLVKKPGPITSQNTFVRLGSKRSVASNVYQKQPIISHRR